MLHNIHVINIGNALMDCGGHALLRSARRMTSLTGPSCKVVLSGNENKKNDGKFLQFVRYRKPAWGRIPGTKLGRVIEHKKQDPEEAEDLMNRFRVYRTAVRSVRAALELEMKEATENKAEAVEIVDTGRMEFIRETNDLWNKRSAEIRKSFEAEELAAKEREYDELVKEIEDIKNAKKQEASKLLGRIKKERLSYIDCSRLDEEIEESLNQRSVFNFYINKDGIRFVENSDGSVSEVDKEGNPVKSESETAQVDRNLFEHVAEEAASRTQVHPLDDVGESLQEEEDFSYSDDLHGEQK